MTGEVHELITEQDFTAGVYRVEFDTKAYWKGEGRTPFHEVAEVSLLKKKNKKKPHLDNIVYRRILNLPSQTLT